mgnify:CR=1 FL=1
MRDYFQSLESAGFQFFRIPTALIKNKEYKGISTDAKLLYGLLLDRMSLSVRNNWRDEQGYIFIYYTIQATSQDLGCCPEKACKLMSELERAGLIERRRLGQGKPSRIYVKQFVAEVGKAEFKNVENTNSALEENRILEVENSESNHTENKQTEYIQTNLSSSWTVEDEIKEQLDYSLILEHQPGKRTMLDTIINVIADAERKASETLRVGRIDMPKEQVISRLRQLDFTHIEYIFDCMAENSPAIRDIRAYLLTSLYNAPSTIDAYYDAKVAHDKGLRM